MEKEKSSDSSPHETQSAARSRSPRFSPGRVVATPSALRALEGVGQTPDTLLSRHLRGDLDDHDKQENERALVGARLVSAYDLPGGITVWIITEADRSITTVLLPNEY